jgi:[ribosomal protein S18]-alanine N-acetyltransferase
MIAADLPAVEAIERASFSNPWSEATFRGEIQNLDISFPMVIVHEPERAVVGYIMYWLVGDEAQINNVAVHPDFRGKGIAEAALKLVLKSLRDKEAVFVSLEVRKSNAPALTLYKKLGFTVLGTRKGYYTNPVEDAYVMGLALGG